MTTDKLKLAEGSREEYLGPAGGYGSLKSVALIVAHEHVPGKAARVFTEQNQPDGFMCVSCAWGKPAKPHPAEFCENGAKATAWEITSKRTDLKFFAKHTMAELETWRDYDLETVGRLTHPLRYNPLTDKYEPVEWATAFAEIGRELKALDPKSVIFYASGRASLETSYMYQLFARIYGSNHLPDSSNMCHEATSVALPESIGATVGTVTLPDFENCDLIIYIAQNVGTNAPRLLHELQDAKKRDCKIIAINPLRERALERFTNPQSPEEMATLAETTIADQYLQVKVGGDVAALFGIGKALIEMDDALAGHSRVTGHDATPIEPQVAAEIAFAGSIAAADKRRALDHEFIAEHTTGFDEFAAATRAHAWADIEAASGLSRAALTEAAKTYAQAQAAIICYGMGLTQHAHGCDNVHMVANLALLRGNVGKPGAGICPVRGHSNVQGQRTVGITEKPGLVPLDRLAELYRFTPPRYTGHTTVEACAGVASGEVKAFIGLGGNFIRAIPDTVPMEAAWKKLRLTVQIATKLNRNHVIHGEVAYLLPCLGRIEIDRQASGPQAVSMESSLAHFHGSRGQVEPASLDLRSEPWIVAEMAKATIPAHHVPWDEWVANYARVRDAIEATYPATFARFNERMFQPGGIPRPLPARERKWATASGKANFLTPALLSARVAPEGNADDVLTLMTLRSNDQFNTTVYGYHDRFRGVRHTRHILFMNVSDIDRLGLSAGQALDITTAIDMATPRTVLGFQVIPYNIPAGCVAGYFPELNPLVPLSHHDAHSKVPAYKSVPVRVAPSAGPRYAQDNPDGLQSAAA